MGNNNLPQRKSRRAFLSLFAPKEKKTGSPQMVKMLTPDGTLVEVDKALLDQAINKKKASNRDILTWMNNPSKENS